MMQITLVPFAILQELLNEEPFLLEYEEECTAQQLLEILSEKYPKAAPVLRVTRLAYNDEYVGKKEKITEGAEYSLIPPVSGG